MTTVLVIGAGRMGGAMLKGWTKALGESFDFAVIDPDADWDAFGLTAGPGLNLSRSAADLPAGFSADVVVVATKPQYVGAALVAVRSAIGGDTVVVSIAAGIATKTVQDAVGAGQPVVRAMPNIGALVGRSVTAAFATSNVTPVQHDLVTRLFSAIGAFSWISAEDDLHIITALSGSGPAYYFAFCEAMIAGAIAAGLDEDVAKVLGVGTLVSAGRLVEDVNDPTALRMMVTSPNGTTAAAIDVLGDKNALGDLVARTLHAAKVRSQDLQ